MNEETLFHAALAKPPAERAAFLDQACADQPALRAAVEALLAAHEGPGSLLSPRPAELDQTIESHAGKAQPAAADDFTQQLDSATADSVPEPRTTQYFGQAQPGIVVAERFTLQEKIGEGGMGEVWVTKQTAPVKRKVALKLIKTGMDSRAVLQRFEQERQALAMMDHPSIARVLDGGMTASGQPFFVMELVNGLPLNQFCDDAKLTPKERLELFIPICQAVQHAHHKGIVHRDLKPANILVTMVDGRPVPKVIDFGVAKATAGKLTEETMSTGFGAIVGTLEYMSPEQAGFSNVDIDTRADIYSLGVILYELLTGLRPIDAQRLRQAALTEMIRIIREEEPSKPSTRLSTNESLPSLAAMRHIEPRKLMALLRGDLDWVVMKCLEKQRERRYETANGLARDIQRYLDGEAVEACPPSLSYRLKKYVKRNRGSVIAAALILAVLLIGIVGTTLGLIEARDQMTQAENARNAEKRRADSEAIAKQEADERRKEAETNLEFARKGNEILGSVFANLNPEQAYHNVADLRNALKENLDLAVAKLEDSSIGDPLTVADMRHTLGVSLGGLGDYETAIELLEKARAVHIDLREQDDPQNLVDMNDLAVCYYHNGQLAKATSMWETAFQGLLQEFGEHDTNTIAAMSTLGDAYVLRGDVDKGIPLLQRAAELSTEVNGPAHYTTVYCKMKLASGYRQQGRFADAIGLFEDLLPQIRSELGADHPSSMTALSHLADAYTKEGKYGEAAKVLEECLDLQNTALGAKHPDTIMTMVRLAALIGVLGDNEKSIQLLEKAAQANTELFSRDHLNTVSILNNLATSYWRENRLDKSIPLFEEVLPILRQRMGQRHPETVLCIGNLGINYLDAGRIDEAIPLLQQAYDWGMLDMASPLAKAYALQQTESDVVVRLIDEHIAYARSTLPTDSLNLVATLSDNAETLILMGKFSNAELLLREALESSQKRAPNYWLTFQTQAILGYSILVQERFDEAEPLLQEGLNGLSQRFEKANRMGQKSAIDKLESIVQFYEQANRLDDSDKWQVELDEWKNKAGVSLPDSEH